jgi:hypothetical protein
MVKEQTADVGQSSRGIMRVSFGGAFESPIFHLETGEVNLFSPRLAFGRLAFCLSQEKGTSDLCIDRVGEFGDVGGRFLINTGHKSAMPIKSASVT